jgi:putative intracellular protease/amidase
MRKRSRAAEAVVEDQSGEFIVRVGEVVVSDRIITAPNPEAAKALAENGAGTFIREIQRNTTAAVTSKVTPV